MTGRSEARVAPPSRSGGSWVASPSRSGGSWVASLSRRGGSWVAWSGRPTGRGGGMTGVGRSRGSAAVEIAVLMPLFVALFTAAVVLGRTAGAISAVEMAAYDAARTASLARDAGTAHSQATATVTASLAGQGFSCVGGPAVDVDTSGFARPVGTPASVTVQVTCRVSYGDVDLLGVPADRAVSASFVSPLDQYRIRR